MTQITIICKDKKFVINKDILATCHIFDIDKSLITVDYNPIILEQILDYLRFPDPTIDIESLYKSLIKDKKMLNVGGEMIEIMDKDLQVSLYLQNKFDDTWYREDDLFLDMNPNKFKIIMKYMHKVIDVLPTNCIHEYDYLSPIFNLSSSDHKYNNTLIDKNNMNKIYDRCLINKDDEFLMGVPQITYLYTVTRRFTKTVSYESMVNAIVIKDNEFQVTIPIQIRQLHYSIIVIDIKDLYERFKNTNISIIEHPSFLKCIDNITVFYGMTELYNFSGDVMQYHTIKDQKYIIDDKIIIPFSVFNYAFGILTSYNVYEDQLLNFKIKFKNITDYMIVQPQNMALTEYFDQEQYVIQNINMLCLACVTNQIDEQRFIGQGREIISHGYKTSSHIITDSIVSVSIDNTIRIPYISISVHNEDNYLISDLIKHVQIITQNGEILYDANHHMIDLIFKLQIKESMTPYTILTFSPLITKLYDAQPVPCLNSKIDDILSMNITLKDDARNHTLTVMTKYYQPLYYLDDGIQLVKPIPVAPIYDLVIEEIND
jgi:hypothetical protein